MYESISKNNELENEMTLDMSYFWYSDVLTHKFCKSTGTTRVTRLLVQLPVILAESTFKPMALVEIEWQ